MRYFGQKWSDQFWSTFLRKHTLQATGMISVSRGAALTAVSRPAAAGAGESLSELREASAAPRAVGLLYVQRLLTAWQKNILKPVTGGEYRRSTISTQR
jgi:hypothetical protein